MTQPSLKVSEDVTRKLYDTLERVSLFIENGVELGFIVLPTYQGDPARYISVAIDDALSQAREA